MCNLFKTNKEGRGCGSYGWSRDGNRDRQNSTASDVAGEWKDCEVAGEGRAVCQVTATFVSGDRNLSYRIAVFHRIWVKS